MAPVGPIHGTLVAKLGARLVAYADQTGRGVAMGGKVGLYTSRNPDTVRAADALFISHERYGRQGSGAFLDVAPELVVEILSPEDRLEVKIREYLAIGVDRVWLIDRQRRQVRAYRGPEDVETLEIAATLHDGEILPGFALPLSDLFRDELSEGAVLPTR